MDPRNLLEPSTQTLRHPHTETPPSVEKCAAHAHDNWVAMCSYTGPIPTLLELSCVWAQALNSDFFLILPVSRPLTSFFAKSLSRLASFLAVSSRLWSWHPNASNYLRSSHFRPSPPHLRTPEVQRGQCLARGATN